MMLLLALVTTAFGADVDAYGEVRGIVQAGSDFDVDADGTTVGQGAHLDTRARVGLAISGEKWRFNAETDVFNGLLVGDKWDISGEYDERRRYEAGAVTLDGIRPRKLSVGYRADSYDLEVGLQTSHWGLGLIANDGDHQPLFGREDFGDRVFRVKLSTRPLGEDKPVYLVAAMDLVYADDIARLAVGEVAVQGVLGLLYTKGPDGPERGVYVVGRKQWEDMEGRQTVVGVLDAYVSQPVDLSDDLTLRMAAEAAGVFGNTDRALSYDGLDGLQVRSAAAVARLSIEHSKVEGHLRLGWASADGNPDDSTTSAFTADRDFDVGMVLFDEVQGNIAAATSAFLEDPLYQALPPDGIELVTTEGAFQGATYVQPAVIVKPIDQLDVRLGAVMAWNNAPIAQPFYTFRAGGTPTNHLKQATSGRYLGTELDWALFFRPTDEESLKDWAVQPRLEIQGGHALMSDDMGGGVVHLIQAGVRLGW